MKVNFNVLDRQYLKYKEEYEKKVIEVLRKGWYILGPEVKEFEQEFASFLGAKYCVSLASGLDALWIALRCLNIGKGDEVIVQSNAYIATVMSITMNDATPVFVEPNEFYNMEPTKIKEKITKRTKAVLVTHLYGQATNMQEIKKLCDENNIYLIEDCAQSHGAKYDNKLVGTIGEIGCFSFYPSKNLGCFGDGGAIVTNNEKLASDIKVFRNYGSEKRYHNKVIGTNSRFDEIQAALLRIKLKFLNDLNKEREKLANKYLNEIKNENIILPKLDSKCTSVWHLFVIRTDYRDELIKYLEENDIQTLIHYPIPPHLSEAYSNLGYKEGDFPIAEKYANTVLSLPLYNGMTEDEQDYVINVINKFRK